MNKLLISYLELNYSMALIELYLFFIETTDDK